MKMKLKLENVDCKFGSPMGMPNSLPSDVLSPGKLHLKRLKWVDGDYIENAAYFGNTGRDYIYCAWGDIAETAVRIFVRADARDVAKHEVNNIMPNATFYR